MRSTLGIAWIWWHSLGRPTSVWLNGSFGASKHAGEVSSNAACDSTAALWPQSSVSGQVRVDAVAALRNLVDAFHKDDLPNIKPLIPNLLNQLFALMNEVGSCFLFAWDSCMFTQLPARQLPLPALRYT